MLIIRITTYISQILRFSTLIELIALNHYLIGEIYFFLCNK